MTPANKQGGLERRPIQSTQVYQEIDTLSAKKYIVIILQLISAFRCRPEESPFRVICTTSL